MTFNSNKPKVLGLVWFVLRLYSFSIFISCTHFLFLSIFFVWYHFLLCLSLHFFLFIFLFYDNHQQIERECVLWCDKSVVVGPTYLIFFFTKMPLYLFSRKWKHQKVVFSFFKSYFFWILKMKIEYKYKYKAKQVFYQWVEQEIENKYKIYPFFAQTK